MDIKDKKGSRKNSLCFVETYKVVKELIEKGLITQILVTEDKLELFNNVNIPIETISYDIAKFLSDTITNDGVFGICKIKVKETLSYSKCLILDRIQDPSNLGAIIRSACAFGFKTILSINSVYPYSSKSIRSSMGYIFDVDFLDVSFEQLCNIKLNNNLTLYSADMNGIDIGEIDMPNGNFAIIIGNEGHGVDKRITNLSDKTISIPMENNVESLNASVSAGIIMYILK